MDPVRLDRCGSIHGVPIRTWHKNNKSDVPLNALIMGPAGYKVIDFVKRGVSR